jgi:hypothetical protein
MELPEEKSIRYLINFFIGVAQSTRLFIRGGASLAYSIMVLDAER